MFLALIMSAAMASPQWSDVAENRLNIINNTSSLDQVREAGLAEFFVQVGPLETSLVALEARGLLQGKLESDPWSGHLWPNFQGGLGARMSDPYFPKNNWGAGESYVLNRPWSSSSFSYLSPAEKYDLITGVDPRGTFSLTSNQWNLGRNEFATTGTVQTWQGICHGWAPASLFLPTPLKPVTVATPNGNVTFTIDDLKALGSLFWANGKFESVFAGFRCDENAARTDGEGRPVDSKCFDVNPADWHLILTHMIGVEGRPFLMDADKGVQIWNKPVLSYKIEFFDLTNNSRTSSNFKSVVKLRSSLTNLRFNQYRTPGTVYVVGVRSHVTSQDGQAFGVHTPNRRLTTYSYDLELDKDYRIIGGEWRDSTHPDFLWRPVYYTLPVAPGDTMLTSTMPVAGSPVLRNAAEKSNIFGIPLRTVVLNLFRLSIQR